MCDIAGGTCESEDGCWFFQALPTLVLFKDGKPIDKVEVRLSPTVLLGSAIACVITQSASQ